MLEEAISRAERVSQAVRRSQLVITWEAQPDLSSHRVKKGVISTQEKLKGKFQPFPRFCMGS